MASGVRRVVAPALVALVALLGTTVGPRVGAAAPVDDYSGGQVYSVLPPGANGLVDATALLRFELTGTRPPGSQDQLTQYAALLYGYPKLTDSTLSTYFNRESFGVPPSELVRTERPDPSVPVKIYRDRQDVPHVYGQTDEATEFGAGWAGAEDRLFIMDALRHYGEGTLSSFVGPSCADERMDHDQLVVAAYTPEDRQAQVDAIARSHGTQGARFARLLHSYVAGINAYIRATLTDPRLLPADYAAAVGPPQPWQDSDVIAIASLIGGLLGKGGGNEVANAALVQYLDKQLGKAQAPRAFAAFRAQNDPAAPTTILDKAFPYESAGSIDPATTAMPDDASKPLIGGPVDTTPNCDITKPNVTAVTAIRDVLTFPTHLSNALVVDGAHSTTGHPVAVFGPQTAYFAPQALMQEELHGPDLRAEGASFAGTNAIVELGRGEDYAWSATSAGTDVVDTRLEVVCNPSGGAPQAMGTSYVFQGRCLPMRHVTFSETALTKPGGLGAPVVINHEMYFTGHGIVRGWTTAGGGKPVAVVDQRSTFGHELDSGVGFLRWNTPSLTHDASSWMIGASQIQYTFNWFYVDNRDIGYYVSGRDPIRPATVDPSLPTWGTGSTEWQGFLATDAHPHEIDPPQGFFTSWNNKPAPGFSAADSEFGYGAVYRSMSLDEAIRAQLGAHRQKITRAELVQAMESAATVDLTGRRVLPELLAYLNRGSLSAGARAMVDQLTQWLADGAHRRKASAGASQYQHAAAVAIMDELYPRLVTALFDPLFGAGGVSSTDSLPYGYDVFPMSFADVPNSQGRQRGSAYDGGWEGYLVSLFRQLRDAPLADPFPPAVLDKVCGPAGCAATVTSALEKTYRTLAALNATATVSAWTKNTANAAAGQAQPAYDAIKSQAIGIVGQPAIDWQNRPTFQQVVMFPSHRPRP